MKRVLIFSHEFPPFVGGVGVVGCQLAKWMAENGMDVTVVTRAQSGVTPIEGVRIECVDVLPKFWWLSYASYFKSVDLDSFDLIVLNECAPTITAGKFFSHRLLERCVVLVHGLEIENIYSRGNALRKLFGFKRAHTRAVVHARSVVPVGKHMREKFLNGSQIKLAPQKIETIYAGVDGDDFYFDRKSGEQYRTLRGIPRDAFVIASGSRVTAMKGYAEMLGLFKELSRRHPKVYWVICGDGDYTSHIEAVKEADPHLRSRIVLEGRCDRSRLRAVYSGADVFLLLSNYDEALPLAYIEAQLCGLPAIGRNRAGTVETIAHGKSGCLADSDDDAAIFINELISGKQIFDRDSVINSATRFEMRTTLRKFGEFLQ